MSLEDFLVAEVYLTLLVFCRIGTAFMVMPGFGEAMVPAQLRLVIGLVVSFAIAQSLPSQDFTVPVAASTFLAAILVEVFVGFWIGAVARILLSCLHTLGHKIGYVSALANAMAGGQNVFENSSVFSNFLTITAVVIIFMADVHHVAIEGLVSSYNLIPAGALPPMEDFATQGVRAASEALLMSFRFAAPFLVLAVIVNAGLGLANRMMPSLPVYFVATPFLTGGGIALLLITVGGILLFFTDIYASWLMSFRL